MQNFDIIKKSTFDTKSFRCRSIVDIFGLNVTDTIVENFKGSLPINQKPWNVGIICGASGTGKTTIAKDVFKNDYMDNFSFGNKAIIEEMPKNKTIEEITKVFNSVGFATVWSWLKPYHVLSCGEQMRVNLAYCILSGKTKIVFDEFTSVVNREVAKCASHAISKYIKKKNSQFIAVACHKDILNWLEPDWVFDTDEMKFYWNNGRWLRQPIKLEIRKTTTKEWDIFRKYHYLNTKLNSSAQCYVAYINKEPVAFFSYIHFVHNKVKNMKRGHRLVVLPDYQGLGIGHKLSSSVARNIVEKGFRFGIVSSTKSLFYQRKKSKNWIIKAKSSKARHSNLLRKSSSGSRVTFSYEYIINDKNLDKLEII